MGHFAEVASGDRAPGEKANAIVDHYTWLTLLPFDTYKAESEDYVGKAGSGADLMRGRLAAMFDKFIKLGPDEQVTITTGERDGICQSCIVGNHCVDMGTEFTMPVGERYLRIYNGQIGDMSNLQRFLAIGQKLTAEGVVGPELGSPIRCEETKIEPSVHAAPIHTAENLIGPNGFATDFEYQSPVMATAGYVKTVLAHWDI